MYGVWQASWQSKVSYKHGVHIRAQLEAEEEVARKYLNQLLLLTVGPTRKIGVRVVIMIRQDNAKYLLYLGQVPKVSTCEVRYLRLAVARK
jgi:hypothetical protein